MDVGPQAEACDTLADLYFAGGGGDASADDFLNNLAEAIGSGRSLERGFGVNAVVGELGEGAVFEGHVHDGFGTGEKMILHVEESGDEDYALVVKFVNFFEVEAMAGSVDDDFQGGLAGGEGAGLRGDFGLNFAERVGGHYFFVEFLKSAGRHGFLFC